MFKVFAFLRRNTELLTHDEYRAGHVGYHCGQSRRLKNIRGYLVNVWSNTPFNERVGKPMANDMVWNEPANFLDWWDGFPEVFFDDHAAWLDALTVEPTRALPNGLSIDPDWSLDDGPVLFDPVPERPGQFKPCHLLMHEHVIVPVERMESRPFKVMQFFKGKDDSVPDLQRQVLNNYAPLIAKMMGCNGCIINFRDNDQSAAMRGFYPDDHWGLSEAGIAHRAEFCAMWDGAIEYHFEGAKQFIETRSDMHDALLPLEETLFSSNWYVEVDENLIVNPNREPAPDFYYR